MWGHRWFCLGPRVVVTNLKHLGRGTISFMFCHFLQVPLFLVIRALQWRSLCVQRGIHISNWNQWWYISHFQGWLVYFIFPYQMTLKKTQTRPLISLISLKWVYFNVSSLGIFLNIRIEWTEADVEPQQWVIMHRAYWAAASNILRAVPSPSLHFIEADFYFSAPSGVLIIWVVGRAILISWGDNW